MDSITNQVILDARTQLLIEKRAQIASIQTNELRYMLNRYFLGVIRLDKIQYLLDVSFRTALFGQMRKPCP